MSDIFLISDTHFNHNKDFIYEPRGFSSIEEMNETLIENWNKTIKPNDIVYHLGDVFLGQDLQAGLRIISHLNGIKYLAFGNHDTDTRFKALQQNCLFKDIQMGYRLKGPDKNTYLLTHYPTLVANLDHKTTVYSIHGHTHSKDKWSDVYHTYNVNVDAHNCMPVNIEDIYKDIKDHKDKTD